MKNITSHISSIIIVISIIFCLPISIEAKDFVVVIDAGHGGKDGGAVGTYAKEKDITLNVAKLLGSKISNECENIKVVYTRDTDKYLTLQQRANIANKSKGDLFISIHVNSVDLNSPGRTNVAGSSVFTLGLHKTKDNLDVAMRENSVIKMEDNYTTVYSGFDPNSAESYIIFEMNQNKHMLKSINLASSIQNELTTNAGREDKGVRQAGFWVLWATNMPSVLVELDFICNPTQEKFLSSSDGQETLANSIFNAFVKHITNNSFNTQQGSSKVSKENARSIEKTSTNSSTRVQSTITEIDNRDNEVTTINNDITTSEDTIYRIQILTSDKILRDNSREFKGFHPIWHYKDNKIYKYTYESTTSLQDAEVILKNVKDKFPQAFIVKFKNGKRIK